MNIKLSKLQAQDVYCAIEDYLDWLRTYLVDRRVVRKSDLRRSNIKKLLSQDEQKTLGTYNRLIALNKKLEVVWKEETEP